MTETGGLQGRGPKTRSLSVTGRQGSRAPAPGGLVATALPVPEALSGSRLLDWAVLVGSVSRASEDSIREMHMKLNHEPDPPSVSLQAA